MILRGHHYRTEELIDIEIEGDRIVAVRSAQTHRSPTLTAEIIAPAYFDLQINGGFGVSFTSETLTVPEIESVVQACQERGIAAFCPTVITAAHATIQAAFAALAKACESSQKLTAAMPCFHLEGPYISMEDGPRGAHPREHARAPDWEEFRSFQDAAGGRIKLVTLAPETPQAIPFIEKLVKEDIVVALGHSAGPPAAIRQAIQAGARLSTHLGNGCSRLLPRHENILWEQLAADELSASLIPDGHHLPWNLVHCILRCKTLQKTILTCDASPLAGLPPGRYTPWNQELEVLPEGKIVVLDQGVLAGSWDFTHSCVEKLIEHVGLSLVEAHPLAADQPRRLLGLPIPSLDENQTDNLVLLSKDHQGIPRHTYSIMAGRVYDVPTRVRPSAAVVR